METTAFQECETKQIISVQIVRNETRKLVHTGRIFFN